MRSSALPFRSPAANGLRKEPLLPLGIRRTVAAMTVLRVGGLLEDDGARSSRPLKMFVDALHIDVQALRGLAKPLRIAITGSRAPHHDHAAASFHCGVMDLPIRSPHRGAVLAEPERLRQESQRAVNVFVIEVRRDC